MIGGILLLWFSLTFLSLLFFFWDQWKNTPSTGIMTLAWALTLLYTGPLGFFVYLLSCREPLPNTHDVYINKLWKQSIGSLIHCVAGDATAIIVMVAFLHYVDLPNGIEVIVEYIGAYLFGLLIFQALFMRSMYPSYREAVKKTIFAETISMNLVMTGMFPIIVWIKYVYPIASDPLNIYFWGMMSLGTMVGSLAAYPVNTWLVKNGIKHGMVSKSSKMRGMKHKMPSITKRQMGVWILGTYLLFFLVMWGISNFIPIRFS